MKRIIWIIILSITLTLKVSANDIYNGTFIDAHSQVGPLITNEEVSKQIIKNDVDLTLLSIRGKPKTATQRYISVNKLSKNKVRYLVPTKLKGFTRKKPNDDVVMPRGSTNTDWEVELGVIIGDTAKYVSEEDALDYVAGYCVCNDVSERHFQAKLTGQWTKGKSCDTFGPTGPYLVTKDEISDPQNLDMWLDVNGKRMQDGSTKTMVYGVNFLISYLSKFMSLQPGDIISTGTPPGVGMGMKPQVFLQPGDVMKLGIEGLGEQTQKTVSA